MLGRSMTTAEGALNIARRLQRLWIKKSGTSSTCDNENYVFRTIYGVTWTNMNLHRFPFSLADWIRGKKAEQACQIVTSLYTVGSLVNVFATGNTKWAHFFLPDLSPCLASCKRKSVNRWGVFSLSQYPFGGGLPKLFCWKICCCSGNKKLTKISVVWTYPSSRSLPRAVSAASRCFSSSMGNVSAL